MNNFQNVIQEGLRQSGIDVIGDVPWGTHFCQFFESKKDLADVLVPYFKTGLENNEFCMWVTSEPLGVDDAKKELGKVVPGVEDYIASGQLEIIPYTQWYYKGGFFDSDRVLKGWVDKLDQALEKGYAGLRLTGNTFWLEKTEWEDFTEYERVVDGVIKNYRMLAVCSYSLARCNADEVIDVVANHQFALIKKRGVWELIESSERKKIAEELKKSKEDLERLNEELRRNVLKLEAANKELEAFSYSVSHDLRVPLRAIDGFARILKEEFKDKLPRDGQHYLQTICDSSQQMGKLIDDLLTFSRIGRQGIAKQPVKPGDIIRQALSELRHETEGRKVNIAIRDMRPCDADPALMKQVFLNLISNALKFTRTRTAASIEMGSIEKGGKTVYFVKDNGVGFDMAFAGQLFGVFQRLHRPDEYEGTGVGLAIVKRIIDRHGGEVWAEAEVDKGATFYFHL